jgi:DNA-binding MarR family transcriptional regulator
MSRKFHLTEKAMAARPKVAGRADRAVAGAPSFSAAEWPIQHFYMIERQHMANSSRLLRRHGIDHLQWRVLVSLIEHNGLWINEMAARCGFERTTLSKLLDRMETKGLVLRVIEQEDRRRFRIALTRKGRGVYRKCAPLVLGLFDDYFNEFSAGEMRSFMRMLQRIRRNVEARGAMLAQGEGY